MSEAICDAIRTRLDDAIPDATIEVQGGGGHYSIRVVSGAFEGKRTLAKHRMVLTAIADLMAGEAAPVHAVDRIIAETP